MTAQILTSELGNLIQDSKRKNAELRTAAEKALQELKSLPVTSEAQLAADLSRRPNFISPFLIACATHNAKFGATGVSCLQRLSVCRALPRERLTEVLEALRDTLPLSTEIQLKILQALPSLLQNYATEIRGDLLSIALQICSALQNAKNFAVSNTAAATLQQLVITVFDRVASEDENALEIPTIAEVTGDGGSVSVRPAAYDAYKVFNDLNLLVTGEKPAYIRFSSLPPTSTLELIEAVLSNHSKIMTTHPEQIHILRSLLMPLIIQSLSDRLTFPITVRIMRIMNLLIRKHLSIMPTECEIVLGLLNHMLDPEASPLWKRALCLEVFRGIYSDPRLVLAIYSQFDEQEGKKCIFGDNLAAFVRLATEKPAVIGLGSQSTVPASRVDNKDSASEQAVAEAGALAGVIGGPVSDSNANGHPTGISTQWSTLKTPCLEHLDKTDPPALPETYVYSLVLTCITNVSETLAKFVLPLTVHHESKSKKKNKAEELSKAESDTPSPAASRRRLSRSQSFRKKTIPVNPLDLIEHPSYSYIRTTSNLVSGCWPAVLATSSTFLNAALDDDFYRALVRAIQKFTHVAGLLRLSTPRDAFLTTLGKAAVPASVLHANVSSPKSPPLDNMGVFSNAKGLLSVDSLVAQASSLSVDKNRRPSYEVSMPTLGPRNLLCLRAMLNLAIALGPPLQSAWSIVFETLQVADMIMAMSNHNHQSGMRTPGVAGGQKDADLSSEKVETETAAVQAAAKRLFESTVDFPNDAFVELLQALCGLLNTGSPTESGQRTPTISARPQVSHQRRISSISGISLSTDSNSRDSIFALNKIEELAILNQGRMSQYDPVESGWDIFVAELVKFSIDDRKSASARLLAANVLSRTVKEIAELSMADEERNEIQTRILSALQTQILALHQDDQNYDSYTDTNIKIHQISLEALKNVIEQCGESLVAGWDAVFDSLLSVFSARSLSSTDEARLVEHEDQALQPVKVISKTLARSAFGSIQLVCSDFLAAVPDRSLSTLLDLLLKFCSQQEDFNMSLTSITFFWNVSDFLHSRSDLTLLPDILKDADQRGEVRRLVEQYSRDGTMHTLWLQVLLNLSAVTTDKRAELRNSAVQTIQRIFENYAEQLSPSTWMICFRTVLFAMVETNIAIHKAIRGESPATVDEIAAWNETTKTILSSVGILLAIYMENVDDTAGVGAAWSDLLDYFQEYFRCGSHDLGCSVFTTMSSVLSKSESARLLTSSPLHKTAVVWNNYFSHRNTWDMRPEDNQEAFVAYATAFEAIYRLTGNALDPDLPPMLSNLEACIVDSDAIAYSSDIDHMTPLQTQVLECLGSLNLDSVGLPSVLIHMLGRIIVLPYNHNDAKLGKQSPTFVALSKASMALLQSISLKYIRQQDIYSSGAFNAALESLARPIQEKYMWQREGKPPTLWQKATIVALAIMDPGLSQLKSHALKSDETNKIWTQVVKIVSGVTGAQLDSSSPPSSVEKDETFDIQAFSTLRDLVTVSLGSSAIPDSLRRTYMRHLFETSIIHEPAPGEIPNYTETPLEGLYKIRYSQTNDSEPVFRTEMAYECFSELVSLVSVHDGSPERVRLAQAAAPYIILRASLPLRAYIADHPLRGRMPIPESQRRELLFTLKALKDLNSEPKAIPDAPGVTSKYRKHLHRLYPLLVRATNVAKHDAEVFGYLLALADVVGKEFGLEDE